MKDPNDDFDLISFLSYFVLAFFALIVWSVFAGIVFIALKISEFLTWLL